MPDADLAIGRFLAPNATCPKPAFILARARDMRPKVTNLLLGEHRRLRGAIADMVQNETGRFTASLFPIAVGAKGDTQRISGLFLGEFFTLPPRLDL